MKEIYEWIRVTQNILTLYKYFRGTNWNSFFGSLKWVMVLKKETKMPLYKPGVREKMKRAVLH